MAGAFYNHRQTRGFGASTRRSCCLISTKGAMWSGEVKEAFDAWSRERTPRMEHCRSVEDELWNSGAPTWRTPPCRVLGR